MILLINLIITIILSILIGCLVVFIDFCFNEGNIFEKYYIKILKLEKTHPYIFKMLGGCIFCFGTWIYIILFTLICILFNMNFIFIVLGLGLNYVTINFLLKYLF